MRQEPDGMGWKVHDEQFDGDDNGTTQKPAARYFPREFKLLMEYRQLGALSMGTG